MNAEHLRNNHGNYPNNEVKQGSEGFFLKIRSKFRYCWKPYLLINWSKKQPSLKTGAKGKETVTVGIGWTMRLRLREKPRTASC